MMNMLALSLGNDDVASVIAGFGGLPASRRGSMHQAGPGEEVALEKREPQLQAALCLFNGADFLGQ
jgi:hypothetical protein